MDYDGRQIEKVIGTYRLSQIKYSDQMKVISQKRKEQIANLIRPGSHIFKGKFKEKLDEVRQIINYNSTFLTKEKKRFKDEILKRYKKKFYQKFILTQKKIQRLRRIRVRLY